MPYILSCLFLFLMHSLTAKDLGTHGHTFAIEEENLITYLKKRLELCNIQSISNTVATHYTQTLSSPTLVKTLPPAATHEIDYFDPTVVAKQEIKDSQGKAIIQKGETYNPLHHFSLSEDLLFFDGEDPKQVAWARTLGDHKKWILVRGKPLILEERENHPVFFDQFGLLIDKLKIRSIPAQVSQEKSLLKIEMIPPEELLCE